MQAVLGFLTDLLREIFTNQLFEFVPYALLFAVGFELFEELKSAI